MRAWSVVRSNCAIDDLLAHHRWAAVWPQPAVGRIRVMTFKIAIGAFLISLVMAGCAAPAAQETPASNTAATASVHASAVGTPNSAAPTPTAPSDPTAPPAPPLAFESPDGFLPPNSLAVVLVEALHIREAAGLDGRIVTTAAAGEVVYVSGPTGRVVVETRVRTSGLRAMEASSADEKARPPGALMQRVGHVKRTAPLVATGWGVA